MLNFIIYTMIKELESQNANTLVYELEDYISQYEIEIIDKGIDALLKNRSKVNLMIAVNVKGENLGAFVKEFQVGVKYWNKVNKIAYVADKKYWKTLIEIDNFFTKFKEKYFNIDDIGKAWDWLNAD